MKDRIKTLILSGNGAGWLPIASDTFLRGLLRIKYSLTSPPPLKKIPLLNKIIKQLRSRNEALSYAIDWHDALSETPELDTETCNINNLVDYWQKRKAIETYPLIIILHSAAGDDMSLLLKTAHWYQRRRGKLVMFVGNEYDLMAEKISFIRSVEADYICSQLPVETANWLYSECSASQILPMPHALNPKLYRPVMDQQRRNIDIGFIGAFYSYFIGDIERNGLIQFFQDSGNEFDLKCDIRTGNIPRKEWASFLNSCKGIVGAESGTYYLDKKGQLISNARKYIKEHPHTTFDEVFERFFRNPEVEYISGKAISSRHFEPIGTKTCQILLEGYYNGILKPDEHYIRVKKDLSNISDAINRFKDYSCRKEIVDKTFQYAMDEHTYRHRVKALIKAIA